MGSYRRVTNEVAMLTCVKGPLHSFGKGFGRGEGISLRRQLHNPGKTRMLVPLKMAVEAGASGYI